MATVATCYESRYANLVCMGVPWGDAEAILHYNLVNGAKGKSQR